MEIETPLGRLKISYEKDAITSVKFLDADALPIASSCSAPEFLVNCAEQIIEYFEGKRKTFDVLLCPKGTEFQKKVWTELQKIPYGQTVSYQQIAQRVGDPKAIRAVGTANGKNPMTILIPCHRVIGSDGKLTGYAGGLERKQALLDLERKNKQLPLF